MKEVSPYVALSQETWARFSTRFAIASFVEAGWFSERCPRLFTRVHILWVLYSLVGSRLQMFSRSYNQCYLRPALIWQHELVGVASELVMLRLSVFGDEANCKWRIFVRLSFPCYAGFTLYVRVFCLFSHYLKWCFAGCVRLLLPFLAFRFFCF